MQKPSRPLIGLARSVSLMRQTCNIGLVSLIVVALYGCAPLSPNPVGSIVREIVPTPYLQTEPSPIFSSEIYHGTVWDKPYQIEESLGLYYLSVGYRSRWQRLPPATMILEVYHRRTANMAVAAFLAPTENCPHRYLVLVGSPTTFYSHEIGCILPRAFAPGTRGEVYATQKNTARNIVPLAYPILPYGIAPEQPVSNLSDYPLNSKYVPRSQSSTAGRQAVAKPTPYVIPNQSSQRSNQFSSSDQIQIASISPIVPGRSQDIVVKGIGFGVLPPYFGNSKYIQFTDLSRNWNAGYGLDLITLNVTKWTNNEIVISGLGGDYGAFAWQLLAGDQIRIAIANPQDYAERTSAETLVTATSPSFTNAPSVSTRTHESGELIARVPADVPWYPTGIWLHTGEIVRIRASGRVTVGSSNPAYNSETPAGNSLPNNLSAAVFLAPSLTPWSLIAKIGSSGDPLEIGVHRELTITTSGELYLSLNDHMFFGNSGHWTVIIDVPVSAGTAQRKAHQRTSALSRSRKMTAPICLPLLGQPCNANHK